MKQVSWQIRSKILKTVLKKMAGKIESLDNEIYNRKEQKEINTHVQENKAKNKEKLLSCNAC